MNETKQTRTVLEPVVRTKTAYLAYRGLSKDPIPHWDELDLKTQIMLTGVLNQYRIMKDK